MKILGFFFALCCPPFLESENSLKIWGKHSPESHGFPWKPSWKPISAEVIKETFLSCHSPPLTLNGEQLEELKLLEHIPLLLKATSAWVRTLRLLGAPYPFPLSDSSQIPCLHSWVLTALDSWIPAESLGCWCRRTRPSAPLYAGMTNQNVALRKHFLLTKLENCIYSDILN